MYISTEAGVHSRATTWQDGWLCHCLVFSWAWHLRTQNNQRRILHFSRELSLLLPFTILPTPLSKYLSACYINIYLRGSGSVARGRALAEATQLAGCKSGNRAQGFEMLGLFVSGDTLPNLLPKKAEQKPKEACLNWAEDVSWWWNLMHNSCSRFALYFCQGVLPGLPDKESSNSFLPLCFWALWLKASVVSVFSPSDGCYHDGKFLKIKFSVNVYHF